MTPRRHRRASPWRARLAGVSLIELMIALVLGSLVVSAVAGVFLSARETLRVTEATTRLQENARATSALLTRAASNAGTAGCAPRQHGVVARTLPPELQAYDDGSARWSLPDVFFLSAHRCGAAACTPALPAAFASTPGMAAGDRVPGTDVLVTRRFDGDGAPLLAPMASADAPLRIDFAAAGWTPPAPGALLVVRDCRGADWFRVSGIGPTGVAHTVSHNRTGALAHAYGHGGYARVYRYPDDLVAEAWSLAWSTAPEDTSAPLAALRRDNGTQREEMLQGVDELRLTLALDFGAGQLQRADAAAVALAGDWWRVRRVDALVLVNSVVPANTEPQPFWFDGTPRAPASRPGGADRRLRREVLLSATVRNRSP
jgi:type IV pilus assembly protein PilW